MRRQHRLRLAALALVILCLAAAAPVGPSPADARGRCAGRYTTLDRNQHYSRRELRLARHHRFKVHRSVRRLVPPVDWHQNPEHSHSFSSQLASLRWTGPLFYAYRQSGGRRPLRLARGLILDWIRHQPYGGGGTEPQAWQNKETGERAPFIGYMLRAGRCEHLLTRHQRLVIRHSAERHGRVLSGFARTTVSNHGLFVDAGLTLLGYQLRSLPASSGWRRLGRHRFKTTLLRRVIRGEGMWLEPSAGYQLLATGITRKFLDIPGVRMPKLERLLRRMLDVAGWLFEPDHRIVQIGDTEIDRGAPGILHRGANDRGMLWLRRSGLAVVKEPGSFLSAVASFHTADHKDSDDLGFDLFDRRHRLVSDTGLYTKDHGRYFSFENSARAHSVLTVDGRDFPRHDRAAYGSGLVARGRSDGWFAIEGANPLVRRAGVDHHRLFLYRPGSALIVVDRVRSHASHLYRRYFQLGPDVGIHADHGLLVLRAGGFRGSLYSEASHGRERRGAVRGRSHPLAGFTFPRFHNRQARWTVRYSKRGRNLAFATTFGLHRKPLRAHLVRARPEVTRLRLATPGRHPEVLRVRHAHGRLVVTER
jgi:hypothetical protein